MEIFLSSTEKALVEVRILLFHKCQQLCVGRGEVIVEDDYVEVPLGLAVLHILLGSLQPPRQGVLRLCTSSQESFLEDIQGRRHDEHIVRMNVCLFKTLNSLNVDVENTDEAFLHDTPYRGCTGPVHVPSECGMLYKLSPANGPLHLLPGDEEVSLSMYLPLSGCPGSVRH